MEKRTAGKPKIVRILSLLLVVSMLFGMPGFNVLAETVSENAMKEQESIMLESNGEEVESITLDKETLTLQVGTEKTLSATVTPEGASVVCWTSSDAEVATVINGVVTGVGEGEATITATTARGKSASCQITVTAVSGQETEAEEEILTGLQASKEKTEYIQEEDLGLDDLTVTAVYENSTKPLSEDSYTVDTTGADMSTPGSYVLKISYTENGVTQTAEITITVKENGGNNDEGKLNNPVYDKDSDTTKWSYVYFGSYPQSEVTDSDTIASIDNAIATAGTAADAGTDVWVDGTKYRRISKDDTNYNGYFDDVENNGFRYFKWERMKWRVLQNDGDTLFVAADKAIDCKDYNEESTNVTWETSTLRDWLNDSFYHTAFSSDEQSAIATQNVVNEDNPEYNTEGGNDTSDKVYLLSISEVTDDTYGFCSDYSVESMSRRMKTSDYANARGTERSTVSGYEGNCWWWLRSLGGSSDSAAVYVDGHGEVSQHGCGVASTLNAVCPALHINLSSDSWFMTDDGTSGSGGGEDKKEEPVIKYLYLRASKEKTEYIQGEDLNLDDLTVTAVYENGTKPLSEDSYTVDKTKVDMNTPGSYVLKISYTENGVTVELSITITVKEKKEEILKGLEAVKGNVECIQGEDLSLDDLTVTAVYENSTKPLSEDSYTVDTSDVDMNTPGNYVLKISYTENGVTQTAEITITVKKKNGGNNDEEKLNNPVYDKDSDTTNWSYVYFGSYPQSEVTDSDTIAAIDNAIATAGTAADAGTDVWVDDTKYRRISKDDTNDNRYFNNVKNNGFRYFKWERMKWRVLQNDGDTLFVAADKAIDCKDYNEEKKSVTWETSTLRDWLNDSFYHTAFSGNEQSAIEAQTVVNEDNPYWNTKGGNNTNDKIYLLSINEVKDGTYGFCSDGDIYSMSRRMKTSDYANARGAWIYASGDYEGNCEWWLRSPGIYSNYATYVYYYGAVFRNGYYVDSSSQAVCPALHINLSSDRWFMTDDGTSGSGGKDLHLQASKEKTEYVQGEALSLDDLTVTAVYENSTKPLSEDSYTVDKTKVDMNTPGSYVLKISYTENDLTVAQGITITVKKKEEILTGLQASKEKMEYIQGEALSLDDLTVTAVYENTTKPLSEDSYTVDKTGVDMNTPGSYVLKISYTENGVTQTAEITITVKKKEEILTGLQASKEKTEYIQGEALSLDDLTVTAVYENSTKPLSEDSYTIDKTKVDMSTPGSYFLKISYTENGVTQTAEITITVKKNGGNNDEGKLNNPVYDKDSDTTNWSYVYFGSYPQSEVTDSDTIAAIDNAIATAGTAADAGTDVWVDGTKYRRISKDDTNYDKYFDDVENNGFRYFKWERMKWRVLQNDGDTLFVVADKAIDCKAYNESSTNVTWETSTLRDWLNDSFYHTAFSSNEQSAIVTQNVVNEDNPEYDTEGGNDTSDKVYLLSISEVTDDTYGFCSSYNRRMKTSDYANARGTLRDTDSGYEGNCWWWLRSPGYFSDDATYVSYFGAVFENGYDVGYYNWAVCPALHINLSSDSWFMTDDGTSGSGGEEVRPSEERAPGDPIYNEDSDTTEWSYIYFGSYPQTEVTGAELTAAITGASYDSNGDAWVGGTKYRRLSKKDVNHTDNFGDSTYHYFKWEQLKWRILKNEGSTLFVMADQAVDGGAYHSSKNAVTWEGSKCRSWLNETFYQTAFGSEEQKAVIPYKVKNEENPYSKVSGGNDTTDRIYLLSLQEATNPEYGFCEEYIEGSQTRLMQVSDYAYVRGTSRLESYGNHCMYWLRTPGASQEEALMTAPNGTVVLEDNRILYNNIGFVPVMHIDTSALDSREEPKNPLHNCTKDSDKSGDTDATDWSYVYFGSYPQSEVTGPELTQAVKGAAYDSNGDAWVNGTKYRRISIADTNYSGYFGNSTYRYFKWERIRWRVLQNNKETLFLMADTGLDCKSYNEENISVTWRDSTLRNWLGKTFYQTAFSEEEQGAILEQTVNNEKNPYYGTAGGSATKDKVYLLSFSEAVNDDYGFCTDWDVCSMGRRVSVSDYAHTMGASAAEDLSDDDDETTYNGKSLWWLRTPGGEGEDGEAQNTMVFCSGEADLSGSRVDYINLACVPVLHVRTASPLWLAKDDGTSGSGGGKVETPSVETPSEEKPTVEKPTVEKPTVEKPTVEKPTVEKPTVEKPPAVTPPSGGGSKVTSLAKPKLKVKVNSYNSVKLSWNKVNGAAGYYIYRATKKNGGWKKIKTISTTSFTDKKLKKGKTYYYRVVAYCNGVTSAVSNTVSRKMLGKLKTPTLKLSINAGAQKYTLSWGTIKNAQKIEIWRGTKKGKCKKWKTVSAKKKNITYSSAKYAPSEYWFQVRAYYVKDGKKIYSGKSNARGFIRR